MVLVTPAAYIWFQNPHRDLGENLLTALPADIFKGLVALTDL